MVKQNQLKLFSISVLISLALCLPLTASQSSSSSISLERQALIVSLRFSQSAPTENAMAMGNSDIGTRICEYLTYKDYYSSIMKLSKAWRVMMTSALKDESNPLVLPKEDKLIAYTNKLFETVPKEDFARISVINALKELALRSHKAGDTLFYAYYGYPMRGRGDKRICTLGGGGRLRMNSKVIEFANLCVQLKEIDTSVEVQRQEMAQGNLDARFIIEGLEQQRATLAQQQQIILEQLKPLLQEWQPYGVFLKLAYPFHICDKPSASLMCLDLDQSGSPLNLIEAPQMSETHPVIQSKNPLFISNQRHYIQIGHDIEDQRIEACHHRIEQAKNEIVSYWSMFGGSDSVSEKRLLDKLIERKMYCHAFINYCARNAHEQANADPDSKKLYLSRAAELLIKLDGIGDIKVDYLDPTNQCLDAAEIFRKAADVCKERAQIYQHKAIEWSEKAANYTSRSAD